jgi:hypothetical protein
MQSVRARFAQLQGAKHATSLRGEPSETCPESHKDCVLTLLKKPPRTQSAQRILRCSLTKLFF